VSLAPCFAKSFAVARPMPEEAPVIITTLSRTFIKSPLARVAADNIVASFILEIYFS
jgi:hypothetical protein